MFLCRWGESGFDQGGSNKVLADRLNWKDFQTTAEFRCQHSLKVITTELLCVVKSSLGVNRPCHGGLLLKVLVHRYRRKGLYQLGKPYRTVIERPRSMRRSSGVTMPGAGGGVRLRKWCFKPGTRDESTSNHFADSRVKISPFEDMPFCHSAC
jgi:hypothetical protein